MCERLWTWLTSPQTWSWSPTKISCSWPKKKAEAQALAQLKAQRAQDLQVHCYRVGDTYLTGPLPDATEPASSDHEILKVLRRAEEK